MESEVNQQVFVENYFLMKKCIFRKTKMCLKKNVHSDGKSWIYTQKIRVVIVPQTERFWGYKFQEYVIRILIYFH